MENDKEINERIVKVRESIEDLKRVYDRMDCDEYLVDMGLFPFDEIGNLVFCDELDSMIDGLKKTLEWLEQQLQKQ